MDEKCRISALQRVTEVCPNRCVHVVFSDYLNEISYAMVVPNKFNSKKEEYKIAREYRLHNHREDQNSTSLAFVINTWADEDESEVAQSEIVATGLAFIQENSEILTELEEDVFVMTPQVVYKLNQQSREKVQRMELYRNYWKEIEK